MLDKGRRVAELTKRIEANRHFCLDTADARQVLVGVLAPALRRGCAHPSERVLRAERAIRAIPRSPELLRADLHRPRIPRFPLALSSRAGQPCRRDGPFRIIDYSLRHRRDLILVQLAPRSSQHQAASGSEPSRRDDRSDSTSSPLLSLCFVHFLYFLLRLTDLLHEVYSRTKYDTDFLTRDRDQIKRAINSLHSIAI